MNKNSAEIFSKKLVDAFLKNKIISPLPKKFTRKLINAEKFRKLCENKINMPIAGYKAGGTAIPLIKKLREKEPFYASVYKKNLLKSGSKVRINKFTLGVELEVCYLIKNTFFKVKKRINRNNITKFISYMAPCIEIVGYRQKKKGIKSFGDLCSDFGGNVKFIIGKKIKYKKINIGNLKTKILNKNKNIIVNGNTKNVYINPLNSLKFVLNKIKKDKLNLDKNFWVFTGSTLGIVPINNKGIYQGEISKLGSVKVLLK